MALEFWGELAPIKVDVPWQGKLFPVVFQLLDTDAERQLASDTESAPAAERVIVERKLRLARSIVSVDNKIVAFPHEDDENQARETWVGRWPGALLYEVSDAYEMAAAKAVAELAQMDADPFTGAAPELSGTSSGLAAVGQDSD